MVFTRTTILFSVVLCLIGLCFFQEVSTAASVKEKKGNLPDELHTISEVRFREALDAFIQRRSGRPASDVVVSKFKVLRNEPVPAGRIHINVVAGNNDTLTEYVRLKAVVSLDGTTHHTVELRAWLDIFATVVCASRDLKRGRVVRKNDLYLDRRNVSSIVDDVVLDMNLVTGLMAKHNIRADDPLKQWMLKKTPLVQRGDRVTILVRSGGLKVTAPGKVLDDGFEGETVAVLNTMSNKKVFARVIDSVTVQVDI